MSDASILVVGGGIAGLTAAIEAAEAGQQVYLIEKEPYLGGRVAQMHRYFPKLCSPYCGLEINFNRVKASRGLTVFTLTELTAVAGHRGDFEVRLRRNPRYVDVERCTACGDCAKVCPAERCNDFNYDLDKTKAVYLPYAGARPLKYVIDDKACLGTACAECVRTCRYDAIDLDMPATEVKLKVGAIVLATGFQPYDATRIDNLGFGRIENVITNVVMERLAAVDGPTHGRIIRPSDGRPIRSVVFVQCAGSRDVNHLPYCSAVCCLASLKQATYVREQYPDAKIHIFYIDIRTPGTYEDFYAKVRADEGVHLIRGKVAKIEQEAGTQEVIVEAEDTLSGAKRRVRTDLVVLAAGMVPAPVAFEAPGTLGRDDFGFALAGREAGIYAAGVAKRPMDVASTVRDATGAALKSAQDILRGGAGG